jgi:hypothetical protein
MTAESACGNRTPMSPIVAGRLPWSPSPDVSDLDVWYEYEYPYVGTLLMRDVPVLFNLLGGVETETTVWAYTYLDPDEARDLADVSFASLTELREFVQEKLNGRQLLFALADDLLISSWAVSEERGDLYEVATTFLDQVLQQAWSKLDAATRFRAKLAEVDTALHDLVKA